MKHLILGTAGHVDHGKTSLIKALTGIDCDTHPEEKRRGITINLGFAHIKLDDDNEIGVVDVPGHKDFVHTMVGGSCGIDIALLVVAADDGIMPQTREHLSIMETLGIKNGIVAITKKDIADDDSIELIKSEIKDLTKGTFLEKADIISISSITGEGLDALKKELSRLSSKTGERLVDSPFRMFVDRIFNIKGFGAVVTGSVLSGRINVGENLFLIPGRETSLRIRRLEKFGREVNEVIAGDRASINLIGIEVGDYRRGQILSNEKIPATSMIDTTLKLHANTSKLSSRTRVTFLLGTHECSAKIHVLGKLDGINFCQIHLEKACAAMQGDRFVIRNSSGDFTLGGGEIIDAGPLHHRKKRVEVIELLKKFYSGEINTSTYEKSKGRKTSVSKTDTVEPIDTSKAHQLEEILSECKLQAPSMPELMLKMQPIGVDEKELKILLKHLISEKKVHSINGSFFHSNIIDSSREKLISTLKNNSSGITVAQFRDLIGANRRVSLLLLSRYDSEGATLRVGDKRILRRKP